MSRQVLRWVVIVLTLFTACVHLFLSVQGPLNGEAFDTLNVLWLLNFFGYLALLAANMLPGVPYFKDHRSQAAYALMAFAFVTILAWIYFTATQFQGDFFSNSLALATKLDEAVLIVVTFFYVRQQ